MDDSSESRKKRTITKPKAILVEGKDADHFMRHACKFYRPQKEDVEVFDYCGLKELTHYLKVFTVYEGFDMIDTIVIVRDAERYLDDSPQVFNNPFDSAFESVKSSIQSATRENKNLDLGIPEKPFEFNDHSDAKCRCAIMIFPGPGCKEGTLEDLCLMTVQHDPIMPCVDSYLTCVQETGEELRRLHKNRLHAFLSGKNDAVGMPIGLAFKAEVFNPNHSALEPFKRIIQQM